MEEIKNIIETVVAIATVFSLIVIWLTLKEMKTQRYKSYEPCILPLNFELFLVCRYPHIILPINTYAKIEDIKNQIKSESALIKLRNIGQGLAKDICVNIDWAIDYRKYLEALQTEFDNLKIGIVLNIGDNSCWLDVDEEKRVLKGGNYPYQTNFNQDFDYLLSVRENEEEIKIEIPSSVNFLFELSILLLDCLPNSEKEKAYELLKEFFHPILKIDYKDNLSKRFCSEFSLNIGTIKIQMEGDIDGMIYTLAIERSK